MFTPLPKTHYAFLAAVLTAAIVIGFYFSHHQAKKIVVQPKLAPMPTAIDPNFNTQVNECFLPTAAVYGYNLRITSGFRSLSEQNQIYEQGRTVDGHIVSDTPAGRSIHNFGFAVDVADRIWAFNIDWAKLGKIAAYCGLEQGPDGDLAHFEHRSGLSRDDFVAGLRPPALSLPCAIMETRAQTNKPLTRKDLQVCGAPKF